MARSLFSDETVPGDVPEQGLGDTGAGPDEVQELRMENARLKNEIDVLQEKLSKLSLGDQVPAGGSQVVEVSDEAARKRLERICKANAQRSHGRVFMCANSAFQFNFRKFRFCLEMCLRPRKLQVPQEIHDQWKAGGASRTKLQEMLVKCDFDKARTLLMHTCHIPTPSPCLLAEPIHLPGDLGAGE